MENKALGNEEVSKNEEVSNKENGSADKKVSQPIKKSVLIISENGGGFTVNILEEAIKNQGIKTMSLAISSLNMAEYIKSSAYVLIVDCGSNPLVLSNVKNICREADKKIMLCGDETSVDAMKHVFDGNDVIRVFKRPIEAGEVARKINELFVRAQKSDARKKVLVVDDNGVMLRTIMGWLEDKYEVALANSATSAFTAIQRNKPDLILLDYEMPVCSGAQFLEMMRMEEDMKDIPVIFLTSRNDADTVREVMALRPNGYILKSTPQERVINSVDNYFNGVV